MSTDKPVATDETAGQLPSSSSREDLNIAVDELATSLLELYQTLSPLAQQTQELTASVSQQVEFLEAWSDFVKSGASSLPQPAEEKESNANQPMES